ncbi:MAG: zf-HC2 domain-containing protein [Candidatus Zixiibacteriota bacterium]|nr:MAG: zf-HC2 domain-containing protein [candidate division Zixibacteria bacterium]
MEHSYFKDRISAYHDRELKHEEEQLIREHLQQCAECRQLLDELEKFDRMVEKHSELAGGEYWEESARRIEAAIRPEVSTTTEVTRISSYSWKNLGWKLAAVAASVAALAFIAFHEGDLSREIRQKVGLEPSGDQKVITAPADAPITIMRVVPPPESADTTLSEVGARIDVKPRKGVPTEGETLEIRSDEFADGYPKPERVRLAEETLAVSKEAIQQPASGIPKAVADTATLGDETEELSIPDLAPEKEADSYEFSAVQLVQDARLLTDSAAKARSEITVDSGETRIVTQMERKDQELGAEIAVKGEQDIVRLAEEASSLEMWRARRDSLSDIVSQSEKKREEPSVALEKSFSLRAPEASDVPADSELMYMDLKEPLDKDQLKQVLDSVYNEVIRHDPEYQLLEAQYQVALLTTDEGEHDQSVKYLRDYLEREDSAYKMQAAWYLQQLDEID